MAEFFDGQQVVFAVHDNEDNLHIHIVVNSVSYDTGLKYGISLNGPETMKRIMNGLIEKYCLKVGIESLE